MAYSSCVNQTFQCRMRWFYECDQIWLTMKGRSITVPVRTRQLFIKHLLCFSRPKSLITSKRVQINDEGLLPKTRPRSFLFTLKTNSYLNDQLPKVSSSCRVGVGQFVRLTGPNVSPIYLLRGKLLEMLFGIYP